MDFWERKITEIVFLYTSTDINYVKMMLDMMPSLINATDQFGNTPLIIAVYYGREQ